MDLVTYWLVKTAAKMVIKAAVGTACPDATSYLDSEEATRAATESGDGLVGIILDMLT